MYASQLDLERLYGVELVTRLSDANRDGQPDQSVIDDALSSASAIVDGYLAAHYSVPLDNPPLVVRDYTVDIAIYRMAMSRLVQTQEMRVRYEDAIAFLTLVAKGEAAIGG